MCLCVCVFVCLFISRFEGLVFPTVEKRNDKNLTAFRRLIWFFSDSGGNIGEVEKEKIKQHEGYFSLSLSHSFSLLLSNDVFMENR